MGRGIGQRTDELHLLDDRSGPSVRDDNRQRIFMFRTNVDEVNIQPVDLGDEIRQGVQSLLARAPVIFRSPIARELLNRRELHALRRIGNRFLLRPPCSVDASAQFAELLVRKTYLKRTNCMLVAELLCSTYLRHRISFGFLSLVTETI